MVWWASTAEVGGAQISSGDQRDAALTGQSIIHPPRHPQTPLPPLPPLHSSALDVRTAKIGWEARESELSLFFNAAPRAGVLAAQRPQSKPGRKTVQSKPKIKTRPELLKRLKIHLRSFMKVFVLWEKKRWLPAALSLQLRGICFWSGFYDSRCEATSAEEVADEQAPPPPERIGMGLSPSGIDQLIEGTLKLNSQDQNLLLNSFLFSPDLSVAFLLLGS